MGNRQKGESGKLREVSMWRGSRDGESSGAEVGTRGGQGPGLVLRTELAHPKIIPQDYQH